MSYRTVEKSIRGIVYKFYVIENEDGCLNKKCFYTYELYCPDYKGGYRESFCRCDKSWLMDFYDFIGDSDVYIRQDRNDFIHFCDIHNLTYPEDDFECYKCLEADRLEDQNLFRF